MGGHNAFTDCLVLPLIAILNLSFHIVFTRSNNILDTIYNIKQLFDCEDYNLHFYPHLLQFIMRSLTVLLDNEDQVIRDNFNQPCLVFDTF